MTDESLEDLEKKLKKLEKEKDEREKKVLIAQKEKELLLKIEKLEAELESLGVEFDLKQKGSELRDEKLASELKQEEALKAYSTSLEKKKQTPKKKEKITIKSHLIGKTLGYKLGLLIITMTLLFSLGCGVFNGI